MENLLQENRKLGFVDVSTRVTSMPEHIRRYITEFRAAKIQGRGMSTAMVQEVEQRSLALRPTAAPKFIPALHRSVIEKFVDQGIEIARSMGAEKPGAIFAASLRTGIPIEKLIDAELRARVEKQAKIIRTSGTWGDGETEIQKLKTKEN